METKAVFFRDSTEFLEIHIWIPASSQELQLRPDTVASVANVLSTHRCSQVRGSLPMIATSRDKSPKSWD